MVGACTRLLFFYFSLHWENTIKPHFLMGKPSASCRALQNLILRQSMNGAANNGVVLALVAWIFPIFLNLH